MSSIVGPITRVLFCLMGLLQLFGIVGVQTDQGAPTPGATPAGRVVLEVRGGRTQALRKSLLNHVPEYVRQPEMAPLIQEREARVVDTHGVQDRGVQIVNVVGILRDVV